MEKLTNTPVKAFLLGLAMTALIQSSTATIVITSGLVGAGVISLLHSGQDKAFNQEYQTAHDQYFGLLQASPQSTG